MCNGVPIAALQLPVSKTNQEQHAARSRTLPDRQLMSKHAFETANALKPYSKATKLGSMGALDLCGQLLRLSAHAARAAQNQLLCKLNFIMMVFFIMLACLFSMNTEKQDH